MVGDIAIRKWLWFYKLNFLLDINKNNLYYILNILI